MAGLVVCQGKKAQIPYYITAIGKNIYTLEELCYYLWEYVHLLEPELINKELLRWIELQLELKELAVVLGQKRQANAQLKELVLCILEAACYASEEELVQYRRRLKQSEDMSEFDRRRLKADDLVRSSKYYRALSEYQRLLEEEEAQEETVAGSIYQNMGVAYARMFFFRESSECFLKAFLASPDRERMRQYKLAVRLCKDDIEEDELVKEFPSAASMDIQVYEELEAVRRENAPKKQEVNELRRLRKDGKIAQYYKKLEQLLQKWSDECREYTHE